MFATLIIIKNIFSLIDISNDIKFVIFHAQDISFLGKFTEVENYNDIQKY